MSFLPFMERKEKKCERCKSHYPIHLCNSIQYRNMMGETLCVYCINQLIESGRLFPVVKNSSGKTEPVKDINGLELDNDTGKITFLKGEGESVKVEKGIYFQNIELMYQDLEKTKSNLERLKEDREKMLTELGEKINKEKNKEVRIERLLKFANLETNARH